MRKADRMLLQENPSTLSVPISPVRFATEAYIVIMAPLMTFYTFEEGTFYNQCGADVTAILSSSQMQTGEKIIKRHKGDHV